jgi:uncharacterized protein YndB with AHSA1/START domain
MPKEAAVSPVAAERSNLAPVRVEVVVPCPPARAFEFFTRDIARWWPRGTHSVSRASCATVTVDAREGGTIYETAQDGSRHTWGTLTRCEPGERLDFTWHPGRNADSAQRVEVRFARVSGGTRVELTHGGWDVLGERAADARRGYQGGWTMILNERYAPFCAQ